MRPPRGPNALLTIKVAETSFHSRFSSSQSPHLEHATTARHLCLIVDCI